MKRRSFQVSTGSSDIESRSTTMVRLTSPPGRTTEKKSLPRPPVPRVSLSSSSSLPRSHVGVSSSVRVTATDSTLNETPAVVAATARTLPSGRTLQQPPHSSSTLASRHRINVTPKSTTTAIKTRPESQTATTMATRTDRYEENDNNPNEDATCTPSLTISTTFLDTNNNTTTTATTATTTTTTTNNSNNINATASASTSVEEWETWTDPTSGRPYYVHSPTGATLWDKPSFEKVTFDDDKNNHDNKTNQKTVVETVETRDTYKDENGGTVQPQQPSLPSPTIVALPEPWQQVTDPNSGQVYYYNTQDGTTSWERPTTTTRMMEVPVESENDNINTNNSNNNDDQAEASTNETSDQEKEDGRNLQPDKKVTPIQEEEEEPERTNYRVAAMVDAPLLPPQPGQPQSPSGRQVLPVDQQRSENSPSLQTAVTLDSSEPDPASENWEFSVVDNSTVGGAAADPERMPPPNLTQVSGPMETGPTCDFTDAVSLLPDGWQEIIDPTSGQVYFFNAHDGTTTWDRPTMTSSSVSLSLVNQQRQEQETMEPESASDKEEDAAQAMEPQEEDAARAREPQEENADIGVVAAVSHGDGDAESSLPANEPVDKYDNSGTAVDHSEPSVTDESLRTDSLEDNFGQGQEPEEDDRDAELSLPDGWQRFIDPASGRAYYVNTSDGVTAWDRPIQESERSTEPERTSGQQQPTTSSDSWQEKKLAPERDDDYGADGSTSALEVSDANVRTSHDNFDVALEESDIKMPLPAGWQELVDPSSSRLFYFHEATGDTTWTRPRVPQEEESAEPERTSLGRDNDRIEASLVDQEEEEIAPEMDVNKTDSLDDKIRQDGLSNPDVGDYSVADADSNREERCQIVLPDGWESYIDPDSGVTYYVETQSGQVSWDPPIGSEDRRHAGDSASQREGLVALPDKLLGPFDSPGIASHTEEDVVKAPKVRLDSVEALAAGEEEERLQAEEDPIISGDSQKLQILPPGWIELFDESTGQHYFFHENDNITSWEKPSLEGTTNIVERTIEERGESGSSEISDAIIRTSEPSDHSPSKEIGTQRFKTEESEAILEDTTTAPTTAGTLPDGWTELIDPSSGEIYYLNEDGTASWDKPVETSKPDNFAFSEERNVPSPDNFSLPSGWEEKADDATGELYYLNTETGITTWIRPLPDKALEMYSSAVDSSALPKGWIEQIDPDSGNHFYFNEIDGSTSWDRPLGDMALVSSDADQQMKNEPIEKEDDIGDVSEPMLPNDWVEAWDVTQGRVYYYCQASGETSWERPVQMKMKEESHHESAGTPEMVQDSLPNGWEELVDPASGNVFYYNKALNKTAWDRPSDNESALDGSSKLTRRGMTLCTFGFGGRLCIIRQGFSETSPKVAILRASASMPRDVIVQVEQSKSNAGFFGPLQYASDESVLSYIRFRVASGKGSLWKLLLLIATQSKGSKQNTESSRHVISSAVQLLLSDDELSECAEVQYSEALSKQGKLDFLVRRPDAFTTLTASSS